MEILQQIIDMDKSASARVEMAVEEERRLSDESGEKSSKAFEETQANTQKEKKRSHYKHYRNGNFLLFI